MKKTNPFLTIVIGMIAMATLASCEKEAATPPRKSGWNIAVKWTLIFHGMEYQKTAPLINVEMTTKDGVKKFSFRGSEWSQEAIQVSDENGKAEFSLTWSCEEGAPPVSFSVVNAYTGEKIESGGYGCDSFGDTYKTKGSIQ